MLRLKFPLSPPETDVPGLIEYRCETDSVLRLKFPLSPPVTAYGRARTHWLFNTGVRLTQCCDSSSPSLLL